MKYKLKKYSTSYKTKGHKYGSHVYATSIAHAEAIVVQRNIGEKVLGENISVKDGYGKAVPEEIINPDYRSLTDYEFLFKLPEIIHTAAFLGFVGYYSRRCPVEDLIGDEGIIHQMLHLMNGEDVTTRAIKRMRGRFLNLQETIYEHYKIEIVKGKIKWL